MARSTEADEDFKLPLRPWLEKQINGGKFTGLEWEIFEGDKKLFRLPWIKKNLPNWKEYYKIFRAWAEHRGRGEDLDDSKLKSNFRCALNKSVDFEEVSSRSQLNKQTGNYKVYRILSPKEVRERKKNKSRVQTKQEHNFDSDDFKTIDKASLDCLNSLEAPASSIDSCDMPMEFLNQTMQSCPPINANQTFLMQDTKIPILPPNLDEFSHALAISPAQQTQMGPPVWPVEVEMEEQTAVDKSPEKSPTQEPCVETESSKYIILDQLKNCGIKTERLRECQIIITYNGEKVLDTEVSNLDEGYRIFYGNKEEQIRLLQMRNTTDEKLSDFMLKGIRLPDFSQPGQTMSAILDKTNLGITIRYDPQTLQLCAKRLCQSQVFFFDPHDHNPNASPQKLEREDVVALFSLEKYFMEYLQQYLKTHNATPPDAEIVLAVGIKPRTRMALPIMKGLKIELIPYALKFFVQNTMEQSSSISLCFSNPTSLEDLLRQIQQGSYVEIKHQASE